MATAGIDETLKDVFALVSHLVKLPETKMWIDYDKEADVLYHKLQKASKSNRF